MITLTATRGDTFGYSCTLSVDPTIYTGGIKFTVRNEVPDETVTTDADALAQVSVGDGITISGMVLTIEIPYTITTSWPIGKLRWDMQGVITGTPNTVHTFKNEDGVSAGGALLVAGDITRSV